MRRGHVIGDGPGGPVTLLPTLVEYIRTNKDAAHERVLGSLAAGEEEGGEDLEASHSLSDVQFEEDSDGDLPLPDTADVGGVDTMGPAPAPAKACPPAAVVTKAIPAPGASLDPSPSLSAPTAVARTHTHTARARFRVCPPPAPPPPNVFWGAVPIRNSRRLFPISPRTRCGGVLWRRGGGRPRTIAVHTYLRQCDVSPVRVRLCGCAS